MSLPASLTANADDAIAGGSYAFVGAATAYQCLQTADDDTTYVHFGATGSVSCQFTDLPSALSVDGVTVSCRYYFGGAASDQQTRLYVIVGGVSYYGSWQNSQVAAYTNLSGSWPVNPATGTAWTPAQVNAAQFGLEYGTAGGESIRYTFLGATVTYTPTSPTVETSRHVASVQLWRQKLPENFARFRGNLDLLTIPLMGIVDMEHVAGPHATDDGWEQKSWQRRPFELHGRSIDLNALAVTQRLKDQQRIRCLVRDLAFSDKASGTLLDGIARFATPGATFHFSRASEHTFTNPVGESETVPADTPAYGAFGLYILPASGVRAANRYYVTNNSGERTWNAAQGTFGCEVRLEAVSASVNQTVAYAYHDASNWAWIYWDGANGRWVFEVRQAGSTYRAVKSASPSSGVTYQIGARWTGANSELDVSPYTLSIWIDRVKGTDVVAGGAMTEVATANLDFGTTAVADQDDLNGQIRKIHSFQYVMTDTEMGRTL